MNLVAQNAKLVTPATIATAKVQLNTADEVPLPEGDPVFIGGSGGSIGGSCTTLMLTAMVVSLPHSPMYVVGGPNTVA